MSIHQDRVFPCGCGVLQMCDRVRRDDGRLLTAFSLVFPRLGHGSNKEGEKRPLQQKSDKIAGMVSPDQ